MSAAGALTRPLSELPVPESSPAGAIWKAYRAERRKLAAQLATRLIFLVCLIGPFAFAAVLKVQSGTPADTLFGAWVHSSGFAISLVVLGFAASWGFPVMAGVLAGDIFSSEDRYGTWKTVLTRSRSRGQLFAGKVIAAMSYAVALVAVATLSSLAAGVLLVGDQSLVNLGGSLISPGHSLALVLASWLISVFPVLAYVSLAMLFSVATRNGIVGVLGPILVALATQLLDLIGRGVWAHMLLIGSAFDGWHGLFTAHPYYGPLAISILVSLLWIAASLTATWVVLSRRDYGTAPARRRPGWVSAVRVVGACAILIAVLAIAGNWGPEGVTGSRLRATVSPEFSNLTLLQQQLFGHIVPPGASLDIQPSCYAHSGTGGPGDWTCTLDVYTPQPGKTAFTQTPVSYDVSVQSNGCYKAETPPSFVGQQTIRDAQGHNVTNPLFIVYGCFNIL